MGEETDLVSADLILMPESTFRKISGTPEDYATDLSVNIRNKRESGTIGMKIIVLLWGAILAFFIFAWDKATGLSAEEKTEIGILKGIRRDTSDVLMMKFWDMWSILFPKFSLTLSTERVATCDPFFLTVVPYTLLTIVPTWKVAVTAPDLVMRH